MWFEELMPWVETLQPALKRVQDYLGLDDPVEAIRLLITTADQAVQERQRQSAEQQKTRLHGGKRYDDQVARQP